MYYPWLSADYQQIMHGYLRGQGHHALLLRTLPGLGLDALAVSYTHLTLPTIA